MWKRLCSGVAVALVVAGSAAVVGGSRPASAVAPPSFGVGDASVVEGDTGSRIVDIPVTLSIASAVTTTVTANVSAGTATAGSDFTTVTNQVLKLKPGHVSSVVSVSVIGDTLSEPGAGETFIVTLSNPTGGAVIGRGVGTGTIIDDDPGAGIRVSIGDVSIIEGDSGGGKKDSIAQFAVTLNVPTGPASVH